ncbi:hypothetical protein TELCIR_01233 [Teladorsagia circumcincta]|uniref:Uncharacterized protein n=1 Tax=Teladorsagia circumcincta TaxID=45464 RepID=A0A2G9V2E6_TELCI|nr:hypothetical protein TELCIR_01233 [Teladorsagia circumcincta]
MVADFLSVPIWATPRGHTTLAEVQRREWSRKDFGQSNMPDSPLSSSNAKPQVKEESRGPESKDIDPWENPEFDVYAKMDRFGFVHKDPNEATEEERANRRRIAKEVKRESKWHGRKVDYRKSLNKDLEGNSGEVEVWPRLLGACELKEARPNLYQELLKRAARIQRHQANRLGYQSDLSGSFGIQKALRREVIKLV